MGVNFIDFIQLQKQISVSCRAGLFNARCKKVNKVFTNIYLFDKI